MRAADIVLRAQAKVMALVIVMLLDGATLVVQISGRESAASDAWQAAHALLVGHSVAVVLLREARDGRHFFVSVTSEMAQNRHISFTLSIVDILVYMMVSAALASGRGARPD